MGINQAIFTSSARGIAKGGGLGIHTYNQQCSEFELSEFVQSFCQYHYDGNGREISKLPRKMMFKKIDNQHYMQAAVTYLGKDYNKEQGRMGNILSHMFSFENADIRVYPLQLYGSSNFRYTMDQTEVDGSRDVSYLPEIRNVYPGSIITIDTVQEFLNKKLWRIDFFCHLMAAVLSRDDIHKVIIYDSHENIIMWLAAVQYALPLQCAIEISFSSYENDPTMSEFDIRGAVYGLSIGDLEEYQSGGQFYVFNGIDIEYPKFDISADYFQDGVQTCMAFAYESMQRFYKFMENYNYRKADMDLCAGFKLFQMMQSGMDVLEESEFQQAVSFESKYGGKKSYWLIVKELFEKLAVSPTDAGLIKSIYIWLAGYFKKELDMQEWKFAVTCVIQLEQHEKGMWKDTKEKRKIWELIYSTSVQKKCFETLAKQLQESGLYQHLGELSACYICQSKKESIVKQIGQLFSLFWLPIPQNAYKYFDLAVREAATIIQGYEEKKKYVEALSIFLKLQDLGNGEIVGTGMDRLLYMISDGTNLNDLKPQKSGFLHKKKGVDGELEQMQTKCAFESFNYTQRNRKDLPIAKIRLLHLGRCIIKVYEEGRILAKSQALAVYLKYPVAVEKISEEEFESYMQILCESIFLVENTKEDYMQLMTYWILEKEQKANLIRMFLSCELNNAKKEDQIKGLAELLAVIKNLRDEEYTEALICAVMEMRDSQREKVTEMLEEKMGRGNKIHQYWKEIKDNSKRSEKNRKGFLRFGRH